MSIHNSHEITLLMTGLPHPYKGCANCNSDLEKPCPKSSKKAKHQILNGFKDILNNIDWMGESTHGVVFSEQVTISHLMTHLGRLLSDPTPYTLSVFRQYLDQYIAEQEDK